MSSSDSPKVRQQAEFELLKSIYDRDVVAAADAEWLDVSITLAPLYDSKNPDVHARILLRVKCSAGYPDKEPTITLSESKGLSKVEIQTLLEQLQQMAKKLRGEVMILELAQFVQEFLHEHKKPATKSFYEEMLLRQRDLEQAKNRSEADKRFKQRMDIKERVTKKEANVSSDERESLSSSDDDTSQVQGRRVRFMSADMGGVQRISISSADMDCEHRGCRYIQLGTKMLRGRCFDHDNHSTIYYGIDNSNGNALLIREFLLRPQEKQTSKELLSHILKQLESVDKELIYLRKFRHENLIAYLDFKHMMEKDHIVTYLVQEFVSSVSLSTYTFLEIPIDVAFIRFIVTGVLHALVFLHQHNVVHKSLKSSSIYISKAGIVKVGNYSLVKRLEDLQQSCRLSETTLPVREKLGRAVDVLQLGALILGLLGVAADTGNPPNLPDRAPPHLKDFLDKCFLLEERRWVARQLLEHSFIKVSLPREPWRVAESAISKGADGMEDEEGDDDEDELMSQLKIPNDLKYQSRLSSEFKVLKYLGSGSFGKVLKAKNRLDGGIYAIKAIELNPRNKLLNRKMIREVKLLSKLNHENVVRYYNSWIETTNVDNSRSVTQVTSTPLQSLTEIQSLKALDERSGASRRGADGDGGGRDDDDEDYDDGNEEDDESESETQSQVIFSEASDSIVFQGECSLDAVDSAVGSDAQELAETSVIQLRSLYIQMEFCERSTLRIAIDQGLGEDSQRCWRLVREIVEGLEYVHQQDMIHRDLKPVNIFLDSYDHVKIGDFGLATTSVLSRPNFILSALKASAGESDGSSHLHTEDSHTGGVGTSFYVAPELQKQSGKAHYNKKVDIYSLGIILFEMAHPPFTTHMERCKTLSSLREPHIVVPPAMEEKCERQMRLVRLLLNHDPTKRPTCSEILAGDHLPPPQVEDSELQDFIRHTLSNPQSKAYKYLISSCFDQNTSLEEDLTYHAESMASDRQHTLQQSIRGTLEAIFARHGAKNVPTPLLLPKTELYDATSACVWVMTHSGSVVIMPYDLRVPFARLIARNDVVEVRRYSVDRVLRERRTHGYHPREFFECAFDIVTPAPGSAISDAEMLCVLNEMVNEVPALRNRNCWLRINHTFLLEAILSALSVEKMYSEIFRILKESREGKYSRTRLEASLHALELNDQAVVTLAALCTKEDVLTRISAEVIPLVKKKEEALALAKKGFEKLKSVLSLAESFGVKVPIKVVPGVVTLSEICKGLMFDLVCPARQKKKEGLEILASGCQYDDLVNKYRRMFELVGTLPREQGPAAVGVSIYLDKVVGVVREDEDTATGVSVVVCSFGHDSMVRAKAEFAKNFWAAGISCYILDNIESLEDLENYGRENRISHLVWLKETERDIARVRSWERDRERYTEKKLPITGVTEYLMIRCLKLTSETDAATARTAAADSSGSQVCNMNIMVEDKMAANIRRRYEGQIKSHLASFLSNFSAKPTIEVLGLFLEIKVVKSITASLDFGGDANDFNVNVQAVVEKYPRFKKYLIKICDKILSLYLEKENLVVILYSLPDDKFKQII